MLLAAIVEQAAGTPFRQYIREEIFARAGLRHTHFWGEAAGERIAAGHDELGNVLHDPATASRTSWFDLGGGQMMSSLDDLRAWAHALSDGAVISRPLAEAMFAPQTKVVSARKGSSGYGWFVQETSPRKVLVQHGGDAVGTGAELKWWMTQGVLLVTSTNVRHDLYPTRNRLEPVLAAILFGERPALTSPSFVLADTPPPAGIEGDYRLESGGILHLERIRGRLYLGATGQDATALLAPVTAELERQREQRGAAARQALAALAQGDPAPLDLLSGGTATQHGFRDAVKQEIDSLGPKPLRSITLLGTFATGFPHGDPPSTETTLLRLSFADRSVTYAIRWNVDSMIGFTEVVALPHAAMLPLQRTLDGSWVGWNIVKEHGVSLELVPPPSLRLSSAGRTVSGIRLDP